MTVVVDSSVVAELLLDPEGGSPVADRLAGEELHAPHLLDAEVLSVLRKLVLRSALTPSRGAAAVGDLRDLRCVRWPSGPLLTRSWALRDTVTAHDALFVSLAEALGAPLLTRDGRLALAAPHVCETV